MLGIVGFATIVDTDLQNHRLALSCGFQCTAHYGVHALVVGDGEVAAFQGVGKGSPVHMGGIFVGAALAIIKQAVEGAEFLAHGGLYLHTVNHHGAVAHYAHYLFFWIGHFDSVDGGHTVAHGIEAAGADKPLGSVDR